MEPEAPAAAPRPSRSTRRRLASSLAVGGLAFVAALALAHGALEAATGHSAGRAQEITLGTAAVAIAAMGALLAVLCKHVLSTRLASARRRRATDSQAEAPRRRTLQTPHFFLY